MTADDDMLLHTGLQVPARLVAKVATWPRDDLTPGWLTALPSAVEAMCARWRIELDAEILGSSITLVLGGQSAALGPVVVKASPIAAEFRAETTALELAAAANVARLYDADLVHDILVMERIVPGTQLREVSMPDDEATRLAATTVSTL